MATELHLPHQIEKSSLPPWLQAWLRTVAIASLGVRVETTQMSEIQPVGDQTAILAVAPHDSHLNTLVVQKALHQQVNQLVTIAKESYFSKKYPKLALWLFNQRWYLINETLQSQKKLAEHIRESKEKAKAELFLIYPQGTRDEPETQPLNRGISFIARQAEVPIVPISLHHSHEILMPKGTSVWQALKGGMRRVFSRKLVTELVSFGAPVYPQHIKENNLHLKTGKQIDDAIMQAVMMSFVQMYCQLGQEVPVFTR